jgi:hypothetical protein
MRVAHQKYEDEGLTRVLLKATPTALLQCSIERSTMFGNLEISSGQSMTTIRSSYNAKGLIGRMTRVKKEALATSGNV